MNIPDEGDITSQYIAALYYLGTHEMLNTAPAVSLIQSVAKHTNADTLAGVVGGIAAVVGNVYRETQEMDDDDDLFVQVVWNDWDEDHQSPLCRRSLQFINAALNHDPQAALMVWRTIVTRESSPEDDTAFVFQLLDDIQEMMARMMGLNEECE